MRTSLLLAALLSCSVSLHADLIDPLTSAPVILIPVAGDAAGANGTYFRSDISVINFRDADQVVQFRWLPEGHSGDSSGVRTITIPARSGLTSEDFVRNTLGQTGIGAIEIIGMSGQNADPNARLHATARIWTPQPNGAAGTFSQTFPATVPTSAAMAPVKWIFGVRRDTRYRLNVGVANPSPVTQSFRVTVASAIAGTPPDVVDMIVPALSVDQTVIAGTGAIAQIIVQRTTGGPDVVWQSWASSVDNATGDAWSQMAFPAAP